MSVAQGEGARLAAAVSLVPASAKVRDHVADGDGLLARRPVALAARRVATSWGPAGARTGSDVGFDTAVLVDAADRQLGIEALAGPGTPLLTVTEPTETATAAAFAHTAVLAGCPGNAEPLAEAGRLFGRLAHLLDAVEDNPVPCRAAAAAGCAARPGIRTATVATPSVVSPPSSRRGPAGVVSGRGARPRSGCAAPARCAVPTNTRGRGRDRSGRAAAGTVTARAANAVGAARVVTVGSDGPCVGSWAAGEPSVLQLRWGDLGLCDR